jgi:hypothetical protein
MGILVGKKRRFEILDCGGDVQRPGQGRNKNRIDSWHATEVFEQADVCWAALMHEEPRRCAPAA